MYVKKRRLFDDDKPDGYLESDREFFENNRHAVLILLERQLRVQARRLKKRRETAKRRER